MRSLLLLFFILVLVCCRKPYTPVLKQSSNNYLVVGGIINSAANGITTIILSRTRNLTDTVMNIPELGASITIEAKSGSAFPLTPSDNDGTYTSGVLSLDDADQYRLNISTTDGDQFVSDYVPVEQTPPIDSVTWQQVDNGDVTIAVNTHDPLNKSRYYWWEYSETWQYEVPLSTPYGISNDTIYVRDSSDQVTKCWQSASSSSILVGTSASLSQDVISHLPILTIPNRDIRLDYRYSILVRQYTITPQAYSYWSTIQTNSEQLGTLFDVQPSQLIGNIRSTKNSNEPVVGFISASAPTQKRMFIDYSQLGNWSFDPFQNYSCQISTISQSFSAGFIWSYPEPDFGIWYFVTSGGLIQIAKNECLDCTLQGGTNQMPAYW